MKMHQEILDGSVYSVKEGKLSKKVDGVTTVVHTIPHPRDQGAVYHGYSMFYEIMKNLVKASSPRSKDSFGYISRFYGDNCSPLLFKNSSKKTVNLMEYPKEDLQSLLGEKTGQKVHEYNQEIKRIAEINPKQQTLGR